MSHDGTCRAEYNSTSNHFEMEIGFNCGSALNIDNSINTIILQVNFIFIPPCPNQITHAHCQCAKFSKTHLITQADHIQSMQLIFNVQNYACSILETVTCLLGCWIRKGTTDKRTKEYLFISLHYHILIPISSRKPLEASPKASRKHDPGYVAYA